jgi:hypothetical protein
LRSLRFLTSSMAACHGSRLPLPLLALEAATLTAARRDLMVVLLLLLGARALTGTARPRAEGLGQHSRCRCPAHRACACAVWTGSIVLLCRQNPCLRSAPLRRLDQHNETEQEQCGWLGQQGGLEGLGCTGLHSKRL